MIDMHPQLATLIMLGGILVVVLIGYPIALSVGGFALVMGLLVYGTPVFSLMYARVFEIIGSYVFLAVPLFVLMGTVLERTGIADKMYDAFYLWLGGFSGGLGVVTILLGTILAACVGVIGASVTMLALVALPAMVRRGYSKSLAAGAVCAGGCLGTLIPPSIAMVVYGPMAQVSVGRLFMGGIVPGLTLAALYCIYIGVRSRFQPSIAPAIPAEERGVPFTEKTWKLMVAVAPTSLLIIAVLGTIFLGIAPPTEAAAVGALAAILLSVAYRKFSVRSLQEACLRTLRVSSMIFLIASLSVAFIGVFLGAGGGRVIQDLVLAVPGGRWGAFIAMQAAIFVLGFFIDLTGIIFIMIPIIAPLVSLLGFDPVWFGIITMLNFQLAYLTPPLAPALFYFKGAAGAEFGITMGDIYRGAMPHLALVVATLLLCVAFPDLILWLPGRMLG